MVVLGVISLIFGLIGWRIFRKWCNPVTVFSFIWGFIFILYSLKLIDYYDISNTTFAVFLLQTLSFVVGGAFACRFSFRLDSRIELRSQSVFKEQNVLRYKIVYLFCIISVLMLLSETLEVIKNLRDGITFYEMISQEMLEENTSTGIMAAMKIYILFPTTYSISAISACDLMLNKDKKHWLLLLFNVLLILLYSLQHGARIMLLVFVLSYVFAYMLSDKTDPFIKKMRKVIFLIAGLAFAFSIFLSESRGMDMENLLMSWYKYFSGCVPNLDYWIENAPLNNGYTYGFTSLNGFISAVFILLIGVGVLNSGPAIYQLAYYYSVLPQELSIIGYGIGFNAFVGHSYCFYFDGGLIGVIIGNLLYAYIATNIFNIIQKRNDLRLKTVYLLLLSTICLTFVRFQFSQYQTAMALIMCILVYRKEKSYDNS